MTESTYDLHTGSINNDHDPHSNRPVALSTRLSLMMFLQYAVWGAWLPLIGRYLGAVPILDDSGARIGGGLGFSNGQIGWILGAAGAVGAIAAPFIAGQVADRWFAAERFLSVMFILGGIVKYITAGLTDYDQWLWMSILYSILYMPTIAISNSLAFAHLTDPDRRFPPIRLWGTIGWIVVSWVFPLIWLQTNLSLNDPWWMPPFARGLERPDVVSRLADALRFSGILSIIYGVYCLTLPHTPPRRELKSLALSRAFGLLRNRGFAILAFAALFISIIHTIYFIQTSQFLATLPGMRDSDIAPAMSIGQFSEIFMLAILGLFLRRLGFRAVLTVGCLAYFARYALFAVGAPTWLVVVSQALHGVCFACFYATAFIYVDRVSPPDVRHSAQTVFGIILLGVGPILAGPVIEWQSNYATHDIPALAAAASVNVIPAAAPVAGAPAGTIVPKSAWSSLPPDTMLTVFDYRRFWMSNAFIGLTAALLIALLFRLDPPASESENSPQ